MDDRSNLQPQLQLQSSSSLQSNSPPEDEKVLLLPPPTSSSSNRPSTERPSLSSPSNNRSDDDNTTTNKKSEEEKDDDNDGNDDDNKDNEMNGQPRELLSNLHACSRGFSSRALSVQSKSASSFAGNETQRGKDQKHKSEQKEDDNDKEQFHNNNRRRNDSDDCNDDDDDDVESIDSNLLPGSYELNRLLQGINHLHRNDQQQQRYDNNRTYGDDDESYRYESQASSCSSWSDGGGEDIADKGREKEDRDLAESKDDCTDDDDDNDENIDVNDHTRSTAKERTNQNATRLSNNRSTTFTTKEKEQNPSIPVNTSHSTDARTNFNNKVAGISKTVSTTLSSPFGYPTTTPAPKEQPTVTDRTAIPAITPYAPTAVTNVVCSRTSQSAVVPTIICDQSVPRKIRSDLIELSNKGWCHLLDDDDDDEDDLLRSLSSNCSGKVLNNGAPSFVSALRQFSADDSPADSVGTTTTTSINREEDRISNSDQGELQLLIVDTIMKPSPFVQPSTSDSNSFAEDEDDTHRTKKDSVRVCQRSRMYCICRAMGYIIVGCDFVQEFARRSQQQQQQNERIDSSPSNLQSLVLKYEIWGDRCVYDFATQRRNRSWLKEARWWDSTVLSPYHESLSVGKARPQRMLLDGIKVLVVNDDDTTTGNDDEMILMSQENDDRLSSGFSKTDMESVCRVLGATVVQTLNEHDGRLDQDESHSNHTVVLVPPTLEDTTSLINSMKKETIIPHQWDFVPTTNDDEKGLNDTYKQQHDDDMHRLHSQVTFVYDLWVIDGISSALLPPLQPYTLGYMTNTRD